MVINLTRSQEALIKCLISLGITDNCEDRLLYKIGRQSWCAFRRDQGRDSRVRTLEFTTASQQWFCSTAGAHAGMHTPRVLFAGLPILLGCQADVPDPLWAAALGKHEDIGTLLGRGKTFPRALRTGPSLVLVRWMIRVGQRSYSATVFLRQWFPQGPGPSPCGPKGLPAQQRGASS